MPLIITAADESIQQQPVRDIAKFRFHTKSDPPLHGVQSKRANDGVVHTPGVACSRQAGAADMAGGNIADVQVYFHVIIADDIAQTATRAEDGSAPHLLGAALCICSLAAHTNHPWHARKCAVAGIKSPATASM